MDQSAPAEIRQSTTLPPTSDSTSFWSYQLTILIMGKLWEMSSALSVSPKMLKTCKEPQSGQQMNLHTCLHSSIKVQHFRSVARDSDRTCFTTRYFNRLLVYPIVFRTLSKFVVTQAPRCPTSLCQHGTGASTTLHAVFTYLGTCTDGC